MKRRSAGILLYKRADQIIKVLLVHPGGPFWANKDLGAWSIPKGEFTEEETPLLAAKREFSEELGVSVPEGKPLELSSFKQPSGKEVFAWAIEADLDTSQVKSNVFALEWPPKSGQTKEFPEIDQAAWWPLAEAKGKIHKGQVAILERLAELLQEPLPEVVTADQTPRAEEQSPTSKEQTSLF